MESGYFRMLFRPCSDCAIVRRYCSSTERCAAHTIPPATALVLHAHTHITRRALPAMLKRRAGGEKGDYVQHAQRRGTTLRLLCAFRSPCARVWMCACAVTWRACAKSSIQESAKMPMMANIAQPKRSPKLTPLPIKPPRSPLAAATAASSCPLPFKEFTSFATPLSTFTAHPSRENDFMVPTMESMTA